VLSEYIEDIWCLPLSGIENMAVCKIYTPRLSFVNGQKVFTGKIPLWDSGDLDGERASDASMKGVTFSLFSWKGRKTMVDW